MERNSIALDFLASAFTLENPFMSILDVLEWLDEKRTTTHHRINLIKFAEMQHWGFDSVTSNLVHDSGKFFSIEGIQVNTNWGKVPEWSQPIIFQPEIGFLGMIAKKFNGILYFLLQAKIEPGNINAVQLSPTLQATKSNYTQVHKGNIPFYLEYFLKKGKNVKVLIDQLQSEQGARFLKKRNRNIIIEVFDDIEVEENFCWLTLGQIKQLLKHDNVINMDTRTVISCIPFGDYPKEVVDFYEVIDFANKNEKEYASRLLMSAIESKRHLHDIEDIISWITRIKTFCEHNVRRIPLNAVQHWIRNEESIYHKDHKYFSVIAVMAEIGKREVEMWTQPLVTPAQEGIIAFIIKKINGVFHFLVQAKLEAGNFDIVELAPTIQCLTGNYRKGVSAYEPEFLDYVLKAEKDKNKVRYSTYQSEEGGRFYKEQNKNLLIEAGDDFPQELPENYIWMTLNQIALFIKFNNYLNVQARSLISAVNFI